jgi:hypothetical protein
MSDAPGGLAGFVDAAARGEVPGVPPLPERAAELFGADGWLRRLAAADAPDGLPELAREAEGAWDRRVRELLGRLTRIEAAADDLGADDDGRETLRAEIAEVAAQVARLRERSAREALEEFLPSTPPDPGLPGDEASDASPDLAGQFLALLGGWAGRAAGGVRLKGLRVRRADGRVTHWQVSQTDAGAEPGPDMLFRRLYAAPGAGTQQVAVYLDDYAEHAGRIAADAAERAAQRAAGTVVFQVTAGEVRALAAGDARGLGAPYEDDAQAAARRGYKILGGDPAELDDLAWNGAARTLLGYLADPDPQRWRHVATATLAGLLVRPGAWRSGLDQDNFCERTRASLYGDPLPGSAGRERTLVRVHDASGCPVTVLIDQRASGPDSPLGSWAGLAVLDDRPPTDRVSQALYRRRWAAWLSWGNLVQFADGGAQLAYTGLDAFDPGTLPAAAPPSPSAVLSQLVARSAWPASALITVVRHESATMNDLPARPSDQESPGALGRKVARARPALIACRARRLRAGLAPDEVRHRGFQGAEHVVPRARTAARRPGPGRRRRCRGRGAAARPRPGTRPARGTS